MATPLVSVVIPTKNNAQFILEAIESVLVQTYSDYEIIVVDDGSIDKTQEVLAPLIDNKRIRYHRQGSLGVSAARNQGVRLANGTFIAFLDSDDLFMPTKLEKQMVVYSRDPELGFVHCNFSKFGGNGENLGVRDSSRHQGWIYPQLLTEWSVLMAMPCMLVRKDVFERVGGFDEQMRWAEDMDLWRRIGRLYRVGTASETLVKVRVHAGSTTFEKSGGSDGFKRYLAKAFADDPTLGLIFKRRASAKMYTKLAQNLLGEGRGTQMRLARQHLLNALGVWPLQLSTLATLLATLLPLEVRRGLVRWLRRSRYSL